MLWLPDSASELLAVTIDPSQSGDTEWNEMLLVNNASAQWLNGQMDTGTYEDVIEYAGLNPVEFIESAERYIYSRYERFHP